MEILHYPRLDTVIMVEDRLKEIDFHPTKKELWTSLPKKVQYQTFKVILNYLEESNKIMFEKNKIVWIFNPEMVKNSVEINL